MAAPSLPRVSVTPPPLAGGEVRSGSLSLNAVAAWNTGVYAGELLRFGFDVELRDYHARGLTQGLLWVGRPGLEPGMVRVELDPESNSLRGVWDRCVVVLYGSQLNALSGMVCRNLRRLREHGSGRPPETVATQEAFLVRLLEALAEAGANNRYDASARPERALTVVPDYEEN